MPAMPFFFSCRQCEFVTTNLAVADAHVFDHECGRIPSTKPETETAELDRFPWPMGQDYALVVLCEDTEQEVMNFPSMGYEEARHWTQFANENFPSYRRMLVWNEPGSYHENMKAIGAQMLTLTLADLKVTQ